MVLTTVSIKCRVCELEFRVPPSQVKRRSPKYCSKKCEAEARKKPRIQVVCGFCGTSFGKLECRIKSVNYCSKKCTQLARRREDAKWKNKEHIAAYMSQYSKVYVARNQERVKAQRERYKQSGMRKIVQRRYREKNSAKIQALYRRRYHAKITGNLTTAQWKSVLEQHGHKCAACNKQVKLTIDHIVPLSCGGSHTLSNVQPLCKSCNSRKNTKTIDYRQSKVQA